MAPAPRRRNLISHRRRVEDEVDDNGHTNGHEVDDDSLTDGTIGTDDRDAGADSDTSNVDEASPTSGAAQHTSNGSAKHSNNRRSRQKPAPAAASMLVPMPDKPSDGQKQLEPTPAEANDGVPSPPRSPSAPVIVSSSSAMNPVAHDANARRRNENDDYKRRRDQDPAFVPNRGAFFMHDSRQAAVPPGSALRPFGRGRGRGGRGGYVGNNYGRIHSMYQPTDPTTQMPWTHDMHDNFSHVHYRRPRQMVEEEGPPNGNGYIPTCRESDTPINRTLSTERHVGNAQVRVYLPGMKDAIAFPGMPVKQYTKLPDHRPPLRRDKPVRISLPERAPRYVYPANDRSFTFIPRALRPNQQQRIRGKPRSNFGSVSGFSRRTSIFGGSYYDSMYSPSVNLSRRSSIVHDREFMFSPTGSTISRAPHLVDNRPVVRLPPAPRMDMMVPNVGAQFGPTAAASDIPPSGIEGPQVDGQPTALLPMHQPRPQKNISVAHLVSPIVAPGGQPFQQAFHQQVPVQATGGYQRDGHSRRQSYSQRVSGTPLSHIPERSVHAAQFNPAAYPHQGYYQGQQPQHHPQGYYYQGTYPLTGPSSSYPSNAPSPMASNYAMQAQIDQSATNAGGHSGSSNLVAQEVNGMVYYYDPSQMQPPTTFPSYSGTHGYPPGSMGMHGMMTPSPDTFYYQQTGPGMGYYT